MKTHHETITHLRNCARKLGIDYDRAFYRNLNGAINRHPENIKDRHRVFALAYAKPSESGCFYSYPEIAAAVGICHSGILDAVHAVGRPQSRAGSRRRSRVSWRIAGILGEIAAFSKRPGDIRSGGGLVRPSLPVHDLDTDCQVHRA